MISLCLEDDLIPLVYRNLELTTIQLILMPNKPNLIPGLINIDYHRGPNRKTWLHADILIKVAEMTLNLHPFKGSVELIEALWVLHNRLVPLIDLSVKDAIGAYKGCQAWFIEYCRGDISGRGKVPISLWDARSSHPTPLGPILEWFNVYGKVHDGWVRNKNILLAIRVVMLVLGGHRVVVSRHEPSYDTITAPAPVGYIDLRDEIKLACTNLGLQPGEFKRRLMDTSKSHKFGIVSTSGPEGHATWTADRAAFGLSNDPVLSRYIERWASGTGMDESYFQLEVCAGLFEEKILPRLSKKESHVILGRLHAIDEWGGKTRVVAILDYWTQHFLSPLHDTINSYLKTWPFDGTFDQDRLSERVRAWTADDRKEVYSFDLTAATDRLPRWLQRDILAYLLDSSNLADAWVGLMADRAFHVLGRKPIRYAVGQPMGAKSSFPMLALTHHIIVQMAAARTGRVAGLFTDYGVLGDDNTIASKVVGPAYHQFMGMIGMDIDFFKSVVHKTGVRSAGEICKRVFIEGYEITSLNPKLIVKVARYGHMAPQLQNVFTQRGSPIDHDKLPLFLANIIGPKALESWIFLNTVPSSISGIKDPVDTGLAHLNYRNWFDGLQLTTEQLIEAFTYAMVCEQLKRVTALIRTTRAVADILDFKSFEAWKVGDTEIVPMNEYADTPELLVKEKAKNIHNFYWEHPMSIAAQEEFNRVKLHLDAIKGGTGEMVARARVGLLDLLRNSLSSIWQDVEEREINMRRSVFNSMMDVLTKMSSSEDRVVYRNFFVTFAEREWSVRWKFGERVQINYVRHRVSYNTRDAMRKMLRITGRINPTNIRV